MFKMDLDWFEFTYIRNDIDPELNGDMTLYDHFLDEFPEFEDYTDGLHMLKYGMCGYKNVLQFNDDFMIWYHPEKWNFGVHVVFPGHSIHMLCDIFSLETVDNFTNIKQLLQKITSRHCNVTRMDICYDDYNKVLTPDDFSLFWFSKRILTGCRTCHTDSSRQGKGSTFYLGKRGSERYLRIYDKEFESKGKINAIRYELELRKAYVRELVKNILNDEKFAFSDLLSGFMQINKEYDYSSGSYDAIHKRKLRAGIDERWQILLDQMQLYAKQQLDEKAVVINVPREKSEYSIFKRLDWFRKQVLPTATVLCMSLGDERFVNMCKTHHDRLKEEDWQMLLKYKKEASLIELDNEANFIQMKLYNLRDYMPEEFYAAMDKINKIKNDFYQLMQGI